MDTVSTALDKMPVPGTELIARVTDYVDVDVPGFAADLSDAAVDGLGTVAEATADVSRSFASTVRRHPAIALLAVGALVAAVFALRRRAGSGEPAQLELADAA